MFSKKIIWVLLLAFLFTYPAYVLADEEILEISDEESEDYVIGKYKLVDKIEKWRNRLEKKYGTDFAFLVNVQYQKILQSQKDEGKRSWAGYHALSIKQNLLNQDFYLISSIVGGSGKGVDRYTPIFSVFDDADGQPCWIYVSKLYLERGFLNSKIYADIGKLDLSSWFDANNAAFSSDTQFMSSAFCNNLVIPFPQKGFGMRAMVKPNDLFYCQAGMANANAVKTQIGLNNAFDGNYFLIGEAGICPKINERQGNYRFMVFSDIEKLNKLDGSGTQQGDLGVAVSFDQEITKKITLFFRYGKADPDVRKIKDFVSAGAQFEGIIPRRKEDVLGIGAARSFLSSDYRDIKAPGIGNAETIYEAYYHIKLHPFLSIIPNLQYVNDPLGKENIKDEIVTGVRFVLLI